MTRQLDNDNGLQARWTETPAGNSGFAIMAGEVRIQTFVQLIKFGGYRQFSVPNPPQRKAATRYKQVYDDRQC